MDISFLREYLVLADCLSFGTAARRLFISQPSLSRHVQAIEDEVGVRLFERDRHSVTLTPAGEEAVVAFGRVVETYDAAVRTVTDASGGRPVRLVVGTPPLYVRFPWLFQMGRKLDEEPELPPPVWRATPPGNDPCEMVLDGVLDAALATLPFGWSHEGIVATRAGVARLCMVLQAGKREGEGPVGIEEVTWRTVALGVDALSDHLERLLMRAGMERSRLEREDSPDAALRRVMRGVPNDVVTLALDLGGSFDAVLESHPMADAAFDVQILLLTRESDRRPEVGRLVSCARSVASLDVV